MGSIEFDHVAKRYPNGTQAVRDLSLTINDGELVVFVGPSGCGKTTALRMVAGLEEITDGEIRIAGETVNDLHPKDRDIAMVFQNYALYPHMSVRDNLGFGLRMRRVSRRDRAIKAESVARTLGLEEYLDTKPGQLSGGQRQRVAMGRAIVREPAAFLMDEPLSNLDAKLRVQMRAEISRIQRELAITTIFVTHDQIEAMTMGDRVAVLRRGVLQQVDEPQRLYAAPNNLFVASFIGSPPMNLLDVACEHRDGSTRCVLGDESIALSDETLMERPALKGYGGRRIAIGIRPESLREAEHSEPSAPAQVGLHGEVVLTEALGPELLVHVDIAARPVVREEALEGLTDLDHARVTDLQTEAERERTVIVARVPAGAQIRSGTKVTLSLDTRTLHFFDLDTGAAISDEVSSGPIAAVASSASGSAAEVGHSAVTGC